MDSNILYTVLHFFDLLINYKRKFNFHVGNFFQTKSAKKAIHSCPALKNQKSGADPGNGFKKFGQRIEGFT